MPAADSARRWAVRARAPSSECALRSGCAPWPERRRDRRMSRSEYRRCRATHSRWYRTNRCHSSRRTAAGHVRRIVDLGCPLRHLERIFRIHRPADHRRAGVTPAITAVTQRMNDEFAFDLIADRTAMTAAGDFDHTLLRSMQPCPLDSFGDWRLQRNGLAIASYCRATTPTS